MSATITIAENMDEEGWTSNANSLHKETDQQPSQPKGHRGRALSRTLMASGLRNIHGPNM